MGPLVQGDARNTGAVSDCIKRHDIAAVIHLAGLIEVARSSQEPDVFWDHNMNGVAAVLAAMRQNGVSRIAFSSTAPVRP